MRRSSSIMIIDPPQPRAEQAGAVDLTTASDHRQHTCDGASVAVPVHPAHVRAAPVRRVGLVRLQEGSRRGLDARVVRSQGVSVEMYGGGGITFAIRPQSSSAAPIWKSAPSGPAISSAANRLRGFPLTRRMTSPSKWPKFIKW